MYHRYKFPICLRYADFDLMPIIHLFCKSSVNQCKQRWHIDKLNIT